MKIRRGNRSGIDPKDDIVPFYLNYPMTQFDHKTNKGELLPRVSENNVIQAKEFVDGNHK